MDTGERKAGSMLQTAFRTEAVCFGAGKAARRVHGGGTTPQGNRSAVSWRAPLLAVHPCHGPRCLGRRERSSGWEC